jgi:asparaginyl-tRNA synthetase
MVTKEVAEEVGGLKKLVPTGTCVLIEGTLAETPPGTKQVRRGGRRRGAAVGGTQQRRVPLQQPAANWCVAGEAP